MKKTIIILSLLILVGCKSKKAQVILPEEPTIEKFALSEVDSNLKNKAYELGKRMLMTCNTSKFKPYDESEATASVINNITEERLSKTCAKYRQRYGTFKDLQLVEIFKNNIERTTIFRYKALYTKKIANKELRVFMNEENKLSSLKTLDWIDLYDNLIIEN
ncbi:hypothetical protein [Flavobacterium frigoris]|uniref:Lipoprotein n=1 Tax=Flavobacterium frigoris (strain PS1) TaxID=1086011 RepID=H7FWB2_FLAFP|nr:hypothetical protein [Flavobacterium frigoris]EIA07187.1 hypothetical protein HJ01_03459 [Flavobacterium frigoris PS1]